MNLSDLQKEGNEMISSLIETKKVMDMLIQAINSKEQFKVHLFKNSFSAYYHNTTQDRDYINGIISLRDGYCDNFINDLRKIRFTKSIIELTQISNNFSYYKFDEFKKEFIELIDKIDDYTESQSNTKQFDKIEEVYSNVTKVTDLYDKMVINISKINELTKVLSPGIESCEFEIRFMNENKSIVDLKDNIILIEKLYNTVNKLVGNTDEELIYYRAESGSLLLFLGGCVTTLLTMLPLLEFSYKVYSEQFSPKAKLDLELQKQEVLSSKIKVRKEYLRLLKESSNEESISKLNEMDRNELLTSLGDLDIDIKELYSRNPYIQLNNSDLGLSDMSNSNIPIELLELACDEAAPTLSELEDNSIVE